MLSFPETFIPMSENVFPASRVTEHLEKAIRLIYLMNKLHLSKLKENSIAIKTVRIFLCLKF